MLKLEDDYWRKLIKAYEESNLSQNDFCSQQGIAVARFKYRWRREMACNNKKERSEPRRLKVVPRFEAVSISGAESLTSSASKSRMIFIQFPNQIRCDFEMPISELDFGLLLKQLVAL